MFEFFEDLFLADFMPHGHCMFWKPEVLWLHIGSDITIALSYYSIPIALFYFVRKRRDMSFNWVLIMFAIFILACGTNHIIDVWTLWNPVYRFEGIMKLVTASASLATAIVIWPLIPRAVALPSPQQLELVNDELRLQINERQKTQKQLESAYDNLEKIVEDRTAELKRVNEALRESEHKYEMLYDSAPDMFVSADYRTSIITQCNQTMATKLGYDKEEIIGKSHYDLYHPDSLDQLREALNTIAEKKAATNLDLSLLRKDGVRIIVRVNISAVTDDNGEIILSNSILRDITELEIAQKALRQNEERLRVMLESLPNAIIVVDSNGDIELMNRRAEQYFGYEKEEIVGQPLHLLIPSRFQENHHHYFQDYWSKQVPRAMGENRDLFAKRKDGSEFPVEVGLTPCRINHKTVIISSVIDITERKHAEETLREKSEALARSNDELKQFAYIASHDLQEPLRKIISFTQKLEQRYRSELDERGEKYITFVVDGAMRMKKLITDLLDFSRVDREEQPFSTIDCNQLLNQTVAMFDQSIQENNAQIQVGDLPVVRGNPSQLSQVFQNLIGNALKFHGAGTTEIKIQARDSSREWTFSIADNGIGIEAQYLDQIFVIFKRLHSRFEHSGTGIGLAICKKIIENHGGRIWVESEPGEGSTFFFTLPKRGE